MSRLLMLLKQWPVQEKMKKKKRFSIVSHQAHKSQYTEFVSSLNADCSLGSAVVVRMIRQTKELGLAARREV